LVEEFEVQARAEAAAACAAAAQDERREKNVAELEKEVADKCRDIKEAQAEYQQEQMQLQEHVANARQALSGSEALVEEFEVQARAEAAAACAAAAQDERREKNVAELEKEVADKCRDIMEAQAEYQQERKHLCLAETKEADLHEALAKSKGTTMEIEAEAMRLASKVSDLRSELDDTTEREETQAEAMRLASKVSDLRSELDATTEREETQAAQLSSEINDLRCELDAGIEREHEQVAHYESEIDNLQSKLGAAPRETHAELNVPAGAGPCLAELERLLAGVKSEFGKVNSGASGVKGSSRNLANIRAEAFACLENLYEGAKAAHSEEDGDGDANEATASDRDEAKDAFPSEAVTARWLRKDTRRNQQVGIIYDDRMLMHRGPPTHVESPQRLTAIMDRLKRDGLLQVCCMLTGRLATAPELELAHTPGYISKVLCGESFGDKDSFVNASTPESARLAVGCTLALVDAGFDAANPIVCGMAVVRPPGHHASGTRRGGFCFFNNVAIAARYAQQMHGAAKVAIIDWDVHHGDGTEHIFGNDPSVLFFSMHRYGALHVGGQFFPGTGGECFACGMDSQTTINVPLDVGYGDNEMQKTLTNIVAPALEEFQPEAIFISAGFDAVAGDPLGKCSVTPQCFAWATHFIYGFASRFSKGRMFLVLEGGYHHEMTARCVSGCVSALLKENGYEPSSDMQLTSAPTISLRDLVDGWYRVPTTVKTRLYNHLRLGVRDGKFSKPSRTNWSWRCDDPCLAAVCAQVLEWARLCEHELRGEGFFP